MHVTVLCGPPCSGKSTLAHHLAQPGDLVLDYDDVARSRGSPVRWLHPEPYRTGAEQELQAQLARAYEDDSDATCWLIRTAPRISTRVALAQAWQAPVYVLDPGERECRRRARADGRPPGTGQRIGEWYHRYRPWLHDLDGRSLLT
ncbi:AAA family ATPase [Amycolatopsis sp. NPDC004772]